MLMFESFNLRRLVGSVFNMLKHMQSGEIFLMIAGPAKEQSRGGTGRGSAGRGGSRQEESLVREAAFA